MLSTHGSAAIALDFEAPGWPVPIHSVEKELARLWQESSESKTRASLANFVIISRSRAHIAENTALLASITAEHACRAILLLLEPSHTQPTARAWISTHCRLSQQRGSEICSEQITFYLAGHCALHWPSVIFSHLDSDLPLIVWWQGELPAAPDPDFWRWTDRLLFDSSEWPAPATGFQRALRIGTLMPSRAAEQPLLCDLSWTRLFETRYALASLFDHQAALDALARIHTVRITHAPGAHTPAALFLGWLAAQLGWSLRATDHHITFTTPSQTQGTATLTEGPPTPGLLDCELLATSAQFALRRSPGQNHYLLTSAGPSVPTIHKAVPLPPLNPEALVAAELARAGTHPGWFRAIQTAEPLLRP